MSSLIVNIEKIEDVYKHPNADRLDIVKIKGWQCIVGRDTYKVGDKAIYIPIDSVLPEDVENKIFLGSKVKLHNSRVKTIKLRGTISQGLVVPPELFDVGHFKIGESVAEVLGIKKYEPPTRPKNMSEVGKSTKKQVNPNFKKYLKIQHLCNFPRFMNGHNVVVTEKCHGTNYRVSYTKTYNKNIFQKLLSKIGLRKKYEFVYGSHNVQLQNKFLTKTYYSKNVYAEITSRYNFKKILKDGECIYGEIYGDGIQKGYKYGLKDEIDLVVFDVKINDEFLNIVDAEKFCNDRGLKFVPILCYGNFNDIDIDSFFNSPSVISEKQKVKEGIVIKSTDNYKTGQYVFKHINPEYLLKENTDYH